MIQSIYSLARELKENYEIDKIDTVAGLSFNMYETLREIEFITSGHYISGDYDEYGDLKPFHDIITRILENQRTAEEVDTKDMQIATKDPEYFVRASLVSKWNQDWMDEEHIDQVINDAIETRGKNGGLLLKVTEDSEDLDIEVADWTTFSGDAADLENGLKMFNHFYTPAGLLDEAEERGWDIDMCKEAIELYAEANQNDDLRKQRETTGKYILVREISGVLEKQYMDENADEHEYSYQIHYIAGSEFKDADGNDKGKTLKSVELEQSPYYYLPYKKRTSSGKMLGIGMVERGKHAQVNTNKAAQNYDKAMDLASTHVLQSASKNLKGKNVIKNMKSGTILKVDDGKPISGVDMSPRALQFLGNYMLGWQNQLDKATGTYGIATGDTKDMPADMTYHLGAIIDQNSQSPFDLRREEFAIFWNRIYKERVIPFFIKQLKKKDSLSLKFSPEELKLLDEDVTNYKADTKMVEDYFNGVYDNVPPVMRFATMEVDREEYKKQVDKELKRGKNRRTIDSFPDGYWDDVDKKLYVNITGERQNKTAFLTAIDDVLLQYLQYKPQLDADPNARKLFNQKVEAAGLEPIDFSEGAPSPDQQLQQQQPPTQPPTGNKPTLPPPDVSAKPK